MQPIAGQFRTIQPRVTGFNPAQSGRDPAPSRLSYKLNRWFLSPVLKAVFRVGIPGAIICFLALSFLSNEAAIARFNAKVSEAQQSVAARPEYQIETVAVTGASPQLEIEVSRALGVTFPVSGLDLDLDQIQSSLIAMPAVETAYVNLAPKGVLEVAVKEVPAVAVWRTTDGLHMIAQDGAVLRKVAQRGIAADMPLVAGEGAPLHLGEASLILQELLPIAEEVRGLVRVGQRRWDVVLTNDRKIALPEKDPAMALRQVLVLADSRDLLNRDIAVVDFRVPHRPTVRLKPHAVEALKQARGVSIEGFAQ